MLCNNRACFKLLNAAMGYCFVEDRYARRFTVRENGIEGFVPTFVAHRGQMRSVLYFGGV
jgi:hypothetical protein